MALNDTTESEMTAVVAALRRQCVDAGIALLDTSVWSDAAARQAQQGALNQYAAKVEDLDSRLRADVRSGALSIDKWRSIAQTTQDGVASIAGYSIGWSDFWAGVVTQTAADVHTEVSKAADTVQANLPLYLGIAGAFLLLILAIKVT